MSYYDNDSFYDDNSIHSYDEQPAGGYYSPPENTPMGLGSRRRRRALNAFLGVLGILILLALSLGVLYVVRNGGVSLERTDGGFTLSLGAKAELPEAPVSDAPEAPAAAEPSAPGTQANGADEAAQSAPIGTGVTLELSESPLSAPTKQSDEADALSLQEIYQRVIASVVSISSATPSGTATGTGIIMSEDGYVITNHHVIEDAQVISVLTSDDQQYGAVLVGSDETSDLAVLKMDVSGLQPAQFGDSTQLRVGDSVVAIGDPLGVQLRGTMTSGIISAINRDLTVGDRTMTLIQTDAALNNGNSGGPLINCYGQVIGINTMKMSSYYSSSASVEGLGFAIPIAVAKPIIDELIENGYVAGRPAIGITGEALPKTFQTYYHLPSGIYVTSVAEGSDAKAKGLAEGDVITAINDTPVTSIDELNTVKNQFVAGDTVTLTVYRGGTYYLVEITLVDQATGK